MAQINVKEFDLRDVVVENKTYGIVINFYIEQINFQYSMVVDNEDGFWDPISIHHGVESHNQYLDCPYCHDTIDMRCQELMDHLDELFEVLKNHPKVRLRFLF